MLRRRCNKIERLCENCHGTSPKDQNAQVFLEYVIIIGVLIMVLFAMTPLIKRGLQGMIKAVADQVGVQENAEQKFDERGHLESSYVSTRASISKDTNEFLRVINYTFSQSIITTSNAVINLGFTNET